MPTWHATVEVVRRLTVQILSCRPVFREAGFGNWSVALVGSDTAPFPYVCPEHVLGPVLRVQEQGSPKASCPCACLTSFMVRTPTGQLSTLWQRSLTPTLHSTTETEFSTGLLAFTFADAFTTACQLPGHKTLRPLWLRHSLIQQKWGLEKPLMSSNQEESQLLPPCLCSVLSCLWKPQTATVVLIQRKRPLVEI